MPNDDEPEHKSSAGQNAQNELLAFAHRAFEPHNHFLLAKDPVSPRRKRCPLGVAQSSRFCGAVAKVLSGPPGEYDRKVET